MWLDNIERARIVFFIRAIDGSDQVVAGFCQCGDCGELLAILASGASNVGGFEGRANSSDTAVVKVEAV